MYQYREWVGRHMKYATGRKEVMYSSMKQTCLAHSKNMIHTCSTCIHTQTHTDAHKHAHTLFFLDMSPIIITSITSTEDW